MANPRFKHNKRRNSGLLYEFLVRKMAEGCIENDKKKYKTSYSLIKKYFSDSSPLSEEKKMYDIILNKAGNVSRDVAKSIIDEIVKKSNNLNGKLLEIKKSNLIKDIHVNFGKSFFSDFRIDEYKVYASIHLLLNNSKKNSTLLESVDRIQLEESLTSYMTAETVKDDNLNEGIDLFTYKIALKKFDDKYNSELNESQKNILKNYVKSFFTEDKNFLSNFILKEVTDIQEQLHFHSNDECFKKDKEMSIKLESSLKQLEQIPKSDIDEATIENLMLFRKLVEEITSDE